MSETQRPAPVLRKEVVETAQWGELVVCQLMASARMGLTAHDEKAEAEEADAARTQRVGRNYAIFLSELMARAVTAKDGVPMYSASDWDAWNVIAGDDCLKLVNKALALNGYRTLDGEDVAKNV